MGRMHAFHDASGTLTPAVCVKPDSAGAASSYGLTVDLASKKGAYFVLSVGNLTGTATVAAYLQDSAVDANGNFANVNTTTYPEATLAASNTANSAREMHYTGGAARQRYVRTVVVVAANTALYDCVGVTY